MEQQFYVYYTKYKQYEIHKSYFFIIVSDVENMKIISLMRCKKCYALFTKTKEKILLKTVN